MFAIEIASQEHLRQGALHLWYIFSISDKPSCFIRKHPKTTEFDSLAKVSSPANTTQISTSTSLWATADQ